ncbi:MAG: hypothetical protein ISS93_02490 [Candidatus Aenigmarchaeota archaeon]|nr:hypothetical protein [Candidatus Aenigmarchaeota archaeon]
MEVEKELRTLRQLRRDILNMDLFAPRLEEYKTKIQEASPSDGNEIKEELSPYFSILARWNTPEVIHEYMKSRLSPLREVRTMFDRKFGRNGTHAAARKKKLTGEYKAEIPSIAKKEKQLSAMENKNDRGGEPSGKIIIPAEPKKSAPQGKGFSLNSLLDYYRSAGLVGEEKLAILQTLGAVYKACFGIESLSGSGKSYSVEMLIDLLPREDVYRMELSSKTAEMYEADTINKAKIIYIPELQKAMNSSNPIIVEALKNITEGKDAQRKVRDHSNDRNRKFVIKGDKGVIFTLAVENAFKYDAEFSRRVFTLYTDISAEQTDSILRSKAGKRHAVSRGKSRKNKLALQSHLRDCLSNEFEYENPFADYLSVFIPRTIRARSYDDYFFNLIEASGLFHHGDRLQDSGVLFLNLEDAHSIYTLYWEQFCKSLLKIPLLGESILNEFDGKKAGEILTAQDIYLVMKARNPSISYNVTEKSMEMLSEAGFLEKDNYKSRNFGYSRTSNMPVLEADIDWEVCWEEGLSFMEEHYPQIAGDWASCQIKDGSVYATDPLTGKRVTLAPYIERSEENEHQPDG